MPGALAHAENLTTLEYTSWVVNHIKDIAQPTEKYGGINQTHVRLKISFLSCFFVDLSTNYINNFQPADHGTSHVSVVDAEGNGVTSTTTINRWFLKSFKIFT